jgi:predicted PhzF superfamily epimerase YddE/YHI9
MTTLALVLVDAFAGAPFRGNQAAVAVLDAWPDDAIMLSVANELNLAETAFVVARPDGDADLRWFTPVVEVDLCGHATLAAAHVLGGTARFHTRSGILACRSADGWIEMAMPADPPTPSELSVDLGLPGVQWTGIGRFDTVVVLADAATVRSLSPDLAAMAALGTRAVVVTSPGDQPGIDMVSRVFAPNAGIPEDPVTGSAHCMLSELWGPRLHRDALVGEQASARGGIVRMRRAGAQVLVSGQAVTVGRTVLEW